MKEINDGLWRSLEERTSGAEANEAHVKGIPLFNNDFLSRREFMEWTSGMVAVLGTSACTRQPQEKLIPYTKQPENVVPGEPLFYASAFSLSGVALGILAESHMGRPTKIEGNPQHPSSNGATDSYAQASVLSLYDPDRAKVLTGNGNVTYWTAFTKHLAETLAVVQTKRGAGLRILTENVSSPTLFEQIQRLLAKYPEAKWHQYEAVALDNQRDGSKLAFGEVLDVQPLYDRAEIILSLDAEFLVADPDAVRAMRGFSAGRRVDGGRKTLNRLYAVESTSTLTGAMAEHRLAARSSEVEGIAAAIASACGLAVRGVPTLNGAQKKFVDGVAKDLKAKAGASLVVAGKWQSPMVHALAHALNERLGNAGKTVIYTQPVLAGDANHVESLRSLVKDIQAGQVETLLILGGNPVYTAPADLAFDEVVRSVANRIHCSLYADETTAACSWHIPEAHYLEAWSDARSYDGSAVLIQPLIAPLYGGKSHHEVLAAFLGETDTTGYDIVRAHWQKEKTGEAFEPLWRRSLHDGRIVGTAYAPKRASLKAESGWAVARPAQALADGTLEVAFRPDPTIYDGRFSNNGWLQELPKPLTKVVWDNAAHIAPATATKLGLATDDVIWLTVGDHKVEAAVWVQPGLAENTVAVALGYGRTHAGKLGNKAGFNANKIRTTAGFWSTTAKVTKANRTYKLVSTQIHHSMEGRDLVKTATLADHIKNPNWAQPAHHGPKIMHEQDVGTAGGVYAPKAEADHAWGMSINLGTCTGCNACVVACQSENNIAVVGKLEVERGREMHWLRIDRYFEGTPENPETHFQPIPCMHCETAPCEVVCPVNATVHDNEGLNNMVYNRCVGTKYCSNNCPYKVRRFNFYEYSDMKTPSLKLSRNPDVTVRSRGVMEKCSFCVQRISLGRQKSKIEKRKIRDGEVKTACQQVCPAEAIIFGDIKDPESLVSMLKAEPLNYGLLPELNTKPRTTYLAKVRNPSPGLASKGESPT